MVNRVVPEQIEGEDRVAACVKYAMSCGVDEEVVDRDDIGTITERVVVAGKSVVDDTNGFRNGRATKIFYRHGVVHEADAGIDAVEDHVSLDANQSVRRTIRIADNLDTILTATCDQVVSNDDRQRIAIVGV